MIKLNRLQTRFRTDEVFNNEVLSIMNRHKSMLSLELIVGTTVLASVPVYIEGGEFRFPSNLFSFVDYRWFAYIPQYLEMLAEELDDLGYKIDIVGMTGGLREDVGIGLVKCLREEEFVKSYDTKMNSRLRQAQRYSKSLSYCPSTVEAVEPLIREWFKRFDNPDIELVLDLYRYWERTKVLEAMSVLEWDELGCKVVACDILLKHDGVLCGLLTPWDRDDEHLRKLWIGWFVIIKACEYGAKQGMEWFSLGDTLMDYKKKFVVKTIPTYYVGLGRREFRDE